MIESTTTDRSEVYLAVRRAVGEIGRGQQGRSARLSSRQLAKDLGVSRERIRDAVARLEAEGLVEQKRGSGIYPRAVGRFELANALDLRAQLEPEAAARAAKDINCTNAHTMLDINDRLDDLLQKLRQADRYRFNPALAQQVVDNDEQFHRTILASAGNPLTVRLIDHLRVLVQMTTVADAHGVTNLMVLAEAVRMRRSHRAIEKAIRHQEIDQARAAMADHLEHDQRFALGRFDQIHGFNQSPE